MRTVEWDCVRGKQVSFLISSVGSENRLNIYWIWLWEIDLISKQQFAALHKAVGKFILDILTTPCAQFCFSVSIRKWVCHSGTCERKCEMEMSPYVTEKGGKSILECKFLKQSWDKIFILCFGWIKMQWFSIGRLQSPQGDKGDLLLKVTFKVNIRI